jgi:hypothetical protein
VTKVAVEVQQARGSKDRLDFGLSFLSMSRFAFEFIGWRYNALQDARVNIEPTPKAYRRVYMRSTILE